MSRPAFAVLLAAVLLCSAATLSQAATPTTAPASCNKQTIPTYAAGLAFRNAVMANCKPNFVTQTVRCTKGVNSCQAKLRSVRGPPLGTVALL
jgi:hypothetical protein